MKVRGLIAALKTLDKDGDVLDYDDQARCFVTVACVTAQSGTGRIEIMTDDRHLSPEERRA